MKRRQWVGWCLVVVVLGWFWSGLLWQIGSLPAIAQLPLPPMQAQRLSPNELRGVWITNVDSDLLFNRDRLRDGMQELARLNINTLYPVVWNWGYTTYPSPIAQAASGALVDPRPDNLQGRDAMAELVQEARKYGMAVIPWFEFGFMVPEDSAIALRHPDWLTRKRNGDITWQEGKYPRVWLNPFLPEVQQLIKNLVLEVVTRYPVDGIQFDDHFGLEYEFGYDPYTVQLYQREHQGKSPPADPKDAEWTRWRANKITQFLVQVFREVKARNQGILVTLSPNNYAFSYSHSLQDWRTWERDGLLEELILQVYRDDLNSFQAELNAPEVQAARRHIPVGVGVLTGLKPRPVSMRQIQQQVQTIRNQGFAGVSFFFYETMWRLTNEPERDRKVGFQALFPTALPRPSLKHGWKPV
jgi:uncharacterized lipoprotein YddW (UPF0748 family)